MSALTPAGSGHDGPSRPIVIYDSGVGGLTVARHLLRLAPGAPMVYVADNEWFPYGDKNEAGVRGRVHAIVDASRRTWSPRAIVIACNTASTAVAGDLARLTDSSTPVFLTTPPVSRTARVVAGPVVMLATPGTLRRALISELAVSRPLDRRVVGMPAMPLVHLAERKLRGEQVTSDHIAAAMPALRARIARKAPGVLLGCTHFPWLLDELAPFFPLARTWIDPAEDVGRRVAARFPDLTDGVGRRSLALTSDHNESQLRRTFARHGFWSHASLGPLAVPAAPALRAG